MGPVVAERQVALAPEPASVRTARQAVADAVRAGHREDVLDAAVLAVSELVTNAVIHAGTPSALRIRVADDLVLVEVTDADRTPPVQREHDEQATTGRGLELVAALTTSYGVRLAAAGKTVWFAIGEPDADTVASLATPPDPGGSRVDVKLVALDGVPAALWLAALDHWTAALRELYLVAGSERQSLGALDLPAAGRAVRLMGSATIATEGTRPSPSVVSGRALDLVVRVAPDDARRFAAMQDALDTAVRLARSGRLLVRPALPEVVAIRDWACEQVISQLAGVPPLAFAGRGTPVGPDPAGVLTAARSSEDVGGWALVVADESNRFVAVDGRAERLLGRPAVDLLGRRLTTIIPTRFREQHVAGFTRLLTTGASRVAGLDLVLPVLLPDGSEIECDVVIDHDTTGAVATFTARMRRHDPDQRPDRT